MKDTLPLTNIWNRSIPKDQVLVSVPAIHKKFKRKSREPKKLFTSSDSEMRLSSAAMLAADSADDPDVDMCDVRSLTSVERRLIISPESTAGSGGVRSEQPDNVAPSQSGAIDMRIGINVPTITPKVSQFSTHPFPEISHWPTSISQPLSNRLKLSLQSTFSMSTSSSSGHSPSQQAFSLDHSLSGQSVALTLPRASLSSQCQQEFESQVSLSKESPRKRVGVSADEPGCVPEVKAIQQTRRLLANARERTRVHTISAAFEALRKQVPCYSYGQKLSKLAILRIACNYILSLAKLAELDYTPDCNSLTFSQCVEQCTRTLQAEGRSKKRKLIPKRLKLNRTELCSSMDGNLNKWKVFGSVVDVFMKLEECRRTSESFLPPDAHRDLILHAASHSLHLFHFREQRSRSAHQ